MKPPICAACGARFDPDAATVRFADYRPLPDGMVGHPEGLLWFCGRHLESARALAHLTAASAVAEIRSKPSRSPR
jgi:hypothetical protein